MKRRYGITYHKDGSHRMLTCVVTGEMNDGTKVWTECDTNKELINIDVQYMLMTRGGYSEFVRM